MCDTRVKYFYTWAMFFVFLYKLTIFINLHKFIVTVNIKLNISNNQEQNYTHL